MFGSTTWKNHKDAHRAIMGHTFGLDLYVMVAALLGLLGASYSLWAVISHI